MRISDWSSDVCSSDLYGPRCNPAEPWGQDALRRRRQPGSVCYDHARGRQFPWLRHHPRRGRCCDDLAGLLRPGGSLQHPAAVRLHTQVENTAAGTGSVSEPRCKEMALALSDVPTPSANYVSWSRDGGLIVLTGQDCEWNGK